MPGTAARLERMISLRSAHDLSETGRLKSICTRCCTFAPRRDLYVLRRGLWSLLTRVRADGNRENSRADRKETALRSRATAMSCPRVGTEICTGDLSDSYLRTSQRALLSRSRFDSRARIAAYESSIEIAARPSRVFVSRLRKNLSRA